MPSFNRIASWALLALSLALPARAEDFPIPFQGECGLITRWKADQIPPNCLQTARNALLDVNATISRRQGRAAYNATACTDAQSVRGLWPFQATDATRYLIILSSQTMFQSSGEGECSEIHADLANLDASNEMECIQGLGKLVCTNGTDTPFSIASDLSTASLTGMPLGKHVGFFRNRFLTANVSGALTRVRLSGELDETDWTVKIPGKSTTPVNIDIAGTNDGKPVRCLMGEYQNAYFIGREDELYALYGNDRRDFVLRKVSDEVGCIEPKSVQEKNGSLYWMSLRGVEKLTGTQIERVSDPIRPTIEEIIEAAGNSWTRTLTLQADWEAGSADLQDMVE